MGELAIAMKLAELLPALASMAKEIIDAIDDKHPAAPIGDTMAQQLAGAANTATALIAAASKS